jgi:hypothetical protein
VPNRYERAKLGTLYREAQRRYRKEEKLLNMLEELPVVALMIYLWRLGYIGLFLGTLQVKLDLWWLIRGEERN